MSLQKYTEIEVVVIRRSDQKVIDIRPMTYQAWQELKPKITSKLKLFEYYAYEMGSHAFKLTKP